MTEDCTAEDSVAEGCVTEGCVAADCAVADYAAADCAVADCATGGCATEDSVTEDCAVADCADVAALYLEEALEVLEASGVVVADIVKTLPPKLPSKKGRATDHKRVRVVSVKHLRNNEVSLIVTPAADVEELFIADTW